VYSTTPRRALRQFPAGKCQKLFECRAEIVAEIAFLASVFGAMMKVLRKGLDTLPPLMRGIIMTVDRAIYQCALPTVRVLASNRIEDI
jgi:hypothetical protein